MKFIPGYFITATFFIILWFLMYGGQDQYIGAVWSLIMAFIITAWIYAFFLLWDSEVGAYRILALVLTGVVGGGMLLVVRAGLKKLHR